MYMIAGLSMLQLYQKRHPDITASAHFYFILTAAVLIFVLVGEVSMILSLQSFRWRWLRGEQMVSLVHTVEGRVAEHVLRL